MSEEKPINIHSPSPAKFTEQSGSVYLVYANGETKKQDTYAVDNVIYHPMPRTPWETCDVTMTTDYKALWKDTSVFIHENNDLPDDRLEDVLTAWVFSSWVPELGDVAPYIFTLGIKNSGKTRLLETLKLLSYRGIKSGDCSDASVPRIIEAYHPTMFFDETERYNSKDSNMQSTLNAGYKRGDFAIRVQDPKMNTLAFFDTFGYKALAGTEPMRGTLESRCIMINMQKNSRPVAFKLDTVKAREIRSRLLWWRFKQLEKHEGVEGSEGIEGVPEELSFSDGRFCELYAPLVKVAKEVWC